MGDTLPPTMEESMEESMNDIVSAVQALVEAVQAEFVAACGEMRDGRWHGLGADARARVARKTREEVKRLTAAFDTVQAHIDALPDGDMTPAAMASRAAALLIQEQRALAATAILRASIAGGSSSDPATGSA